MARVSVIIPIYCVEDYLSECIDSVINQSIHDLEVILIDDGSPDRCGLICDEYASKDERIKVIHQSNHGVSFARNAGIDISTGDYLSFIDPDDFILTDMYSSMIQSAEQLGADIAICGFDYCSENGCFLKKESVPEGVFSQRELLLSIYGRPNRFHGSMCNKIFTRSVIEGLRFDERVSVGEDWLLLFECYKRTKIAVSLADCFYTVRLRSDSATRKRTAQLYMNKLETYERLYKSANSFDREIQIQAAAKMLDTYLIIKNEIIKDGFDVGCLTHINKKMIGTSVASFFKGNLSLKKMIYYISRGLTVR
jgi:glycosyltransferase involved in cell wall biosynthesis